MLAQPSGMFSKSGPPLAFFFISSHFFSLISSFQLGLFRLVRGGGGCSTGTMLRCVRKLALSTRIIQTCSQVHTCAKAPVFSGIRLALGTSFRIDIFYHLAPVVQTLDKFVQRINHYPVDEICSLSKQN